ncbi:LOW QUALITY PROTEIN: zf-CCHC domain-containing protein, partial [Cephalotus follicularis]
DKTVANLLIAGFTGQLKSWCDNVLTTQQTEILEAIQVNELKEQILNNNNEPIEDAVSTLIYNITQYFIGDPTYLRDRTADQFSNLRYRKLQDFRWYKDTFMTKVLTREDVNQPYWKEKFITRLPTLFAKKMKSKYREKHKCVVPYETLTYGNIVSTITKTGLEVCNAIKMGKQIKRDSKTYKKELGDFCTQFEYYKSSRKKTRFKTNNFQKPTNDFQKTNSNSFTCYNCGKSGHTSRYCKIRKQIKKLDLSEYHKNQL